MWQNKWEIKREIWKKIKWKWVVWEIGYILNIQPDHACNINWKKERKKKGCNYNRDLEGVKWRDMVGWVGSIWCDTTRGTLCLEVINIAWLQS